MDVVKQNNFTFMPLLGRLLLSIIFIVAGIGKIVDFSAAVASLTQLGIEPAEPFIVIALLIELLGGLMILSGWHIRIASIALMIFLLPVTLIFHAFWNFQGAEGALQLSLFLKNLAIYGGLILLLTYGAGKWSIDALLENEEMDRTP